MWRYYLIAALIVVGVGSAVFAHRWYARRDLQAQERARAHATRVAHGNGRGAPQPVRSFGGDGPWVMSALPDCFVQLRSTSGPANLVQREMPAASERLAPGTTLRWNDCAVVVGRDDVRIRRGSDRLRVPPDARLYARGDRLTLVWRSDTDRTEIRVYARSNSK